MHSVPKQLSSVPEHTDQEITRFVSDYAINCRDSSNLIFGTHFKTLTLHTAAIAGTWVRAPTSMLPKSVMLVLFLNIVMY